MSTAERIAHETEQRVEKWPSADRAALVERLSAPPVVTELNHGYSVDFGDNRPQWCADIREMRRLILDRALLAAEVRDTA